MPRLDEIGIDPFVLAFTLGVSLLSGVLFGVDAGCEIRRTPSRDRAAWRRPDASATSREHHRARNTLVVVQVALALVLLVGSGLMIRTFQHLRSVQPGFTHPEEIQIVHSLIPTAIAKDPEHVMRMQHEILDKLAAIPGVTSVGLANAAPLESSLGSNLSIRVCRGQDVRGRPLAAPPANPQGRTGILQRRWARGSLRDATSPGPTCTTKRRVAIVSENLAREWWGDPACGAGQADSRKRRLPIPGAKSWASSKTSTTTACT